MATEQVRSRSIVRVASGAAERMDDTVAVEEPLEIRAAGETVAVTMRTPGHDLELAAGFLFAEGIITRRDDVSRIYHCGRPGTEEYGNTVDVVPAPGTVFDLERTEAGRRGTLTTSACGVCGRMSIEDLVARCGRLVDDAVVDASWILGAVDALRDMQGVFARTGGVHAAAAFAASAAVTCREDVGRHNAVDKVVGEMLMAGRIGTDREDRPLLLVVSGRSSFEIVQKAAAARIPVVASVSAPSSMAADLATDAGVTLAGFCRKDTMNVYTHPERIRIDG